MKCTTNIDKEAIALAGHLYEVAIRISENPNMLEGGSYDSSLGPGIIGLFDEYYYR